MSVTAGFSRRFAHMPNRVWSARVVGFCLGGLLLAASSGEAWNQPDGAQDEVQTSQETSELPPSRQELLRRLRIEKRKEVQPYEQNRLERELLKADKAETPTIQDVNFYGFYPRVAWISRGSGMALGGRYWQRDFYGSLDVAGAAFYSWRQYQHYDVQFGLMPHMARRLPDRSWKGDDVYELGDMAPGFTRVPFYVTLRYRYLPQEDYYGSGPDSELEDRTTYLREETSLYLRTGYQFTENIVWMVSGGYLGNEVRKGKDGSYPTTQEVFDDVTAPGLTTPPDYLRFGTQVLFDYRDEPANPHSGFMVALALGRFEDQSEDAFSFTSIGIDSRAAIPLGSRQRILALRGVWIIDQADAGNQVPFFMQKSLGGSHTLRGFDSFRFTGEKVMLYQAEYRWEPSDLWELALFVDTGTVSEADSRLSFSNLEWDYGAGIRFKNWRSVLIRMEIAWSRETTRYYFRTSASF
jgi:hypothetical protein